MPKLKTSTLKKKKLPDVTTTVDAPQKLLPSVKKLKEERWFTRSVGCRDIASLALEENAVQPLLQCGTGELLLPLLFDESYTVRLNAIRAMQNLLLGADSNIYSGNVAAFQQLRSCFGNSLTKLKTAISENRVDPKNEKPSKKKGMEMEVDDETIPQDDVPETINRCGELLTEYLQLLAGFCYYEDSFVQSFSTDVEVLTAVIECTAMHHISSSRSTVAVAAAEFLLLLCDDNQTALQTLQHSISAESQAILTNLFTSPATTPTHILARVIISGVMWQYQGQALRNVCSRFFKSQLIFPTIFF